MLTGDTGRGDPGWDDLGWDERASAPAGSRDPWEPAPRRRLGRAGRALARAARRDERVDRTAARRAHRRRRDEQRPEPRRAVVADAAAVLAALVLVGLGALNLDAAGEPGAAAAKLATAGTGTVLLVVLALRRRPVTGALAWSVYGATVALLLVALVAGIDVNGARRWITVGVLTLQPSELAKIAVPLMLAVVLDSARPSWRRFALAVPLAGVPIVLVARQPDLSTASLLVATTLAVLVLARVPARHLLPVLAAAVVAAPLALGLMHDYQLQRLGTFLTGSQSAEGPGWAVRQARLAIARGGWFGDHADPVHALAASYLPERETDLAPASLVSGWGLLAGALAVLAGLVILWRCALGAHTARTPAGRLLCGGFAVLLGIEVVVSVGGNLGLLPVAGVPFPILSAGGTATVVHLAALGLALGARRDGAHRRLWNPSGLTRPRLVRTAAGAVTVLLVVVAGYGVTAVVAQRPALGAAGVDQMTRCLTLPAPRGAIVDRHGALLAGDAGDVDVRVVPVLLRSDHGAVDRLAGMLARRPVDLHRLLDTASADRIGLDLGVVPGPVGDEVTRAGFPGVATTAAPRRSYPTGPVLAPVLGWVGVATPSRPPGTPISIPARPPGGTGSSWPTTRCCAGSMAASASGSIRAGGRWRPAHDRTRCPVRPSR